MYGPIAVVHLSSSSNAIYSGESEGHCVDGRRHAFVTFEGKLFTRQCGSLAQLFRKSKDLLRYMIQSSTIFLKTRHRLWRALQHMHPCPQPNATIAS